MYRILLCLLTLSILLSACDTEEDSGAVKGIQTSRPEPTSTSAPQFVSEDTNQSVSSIINASNADQLVEYATFGRGTLSDFRWLPDGHTLAVTTSTGVRLYDVRTPETPQQTFPQYTSLFDVDPTATRGLSRVEDSGWVLWSLETGDQIAALEMGDSRTQGAEFSPDGTVINILEGASIRQFDGETGTPLDTLTLPVDTIYAVTYQDNLNLIAVSHADSTLAVWDVMAQEVLFEISDSEEAYLFAMEFKAEGRILVVPNAVITDTFYSPIDIDIWDTVRGEIIQTLPYSSSQVFVSEDGTSYLITEYSQRIELYDLLTGEELLTVGGNEGADFSVGLSNLQLSQDGLWIAASLQAGKIVLYSVEDPEFPTEIADFDSRITGLGLSPDNAMLTIGYSQSGIQTWDIATHEIIDSMTPEGSYVLALATHPIDNTIFAATHSVSRYQMTALADAPDVLMTLQANHLAVSPDGTLLVLDYNDFSPRPTGSQSQSYIRFWNLEANDLHIPDIELPGGVQVQQLVFSPDGAWLAVVDYAQNIHLMDASNGRLQWTITRDGPVIDIAFNPVDGTLAATSVTMLDENTPELEANLQLWDVESGELIDTLMSTDSMLYGLTYSPDGSLLVVGTEQSGILLLAASTGEEIAILGENGEPATELTFSRDGGLLVGVGNDDVVRLWHLPE
ncbi:MAG: WD40 repeat domain-containing protein [Chloroflexi bacterium]|nr:WD40 repeat domain-containing protein [Chloroflexota bacterium]